MTGLREFPSSPKGSPRASSGRRSGEPSPVGELGRRILWPRFPAEKRTRPSSAVPRKASTLPETSSPTKAGAIPNANHRGWRWAEETNQRGKREKVRVATGAAPVSGTGPPATPLRRAVIRATGVPRIAVQGRASLFREQAHLPRTINSGLRSPRIRRPVAGFFQFLHP